MNKFTKSIGLSLSALTILLAAGCNKEEKTAEEPSLLPAITKVSNDENGKTKINTSFEESASEKTVEGTEPKKETVSKETSEALLIDATKAGHAYVGELTKIIYDVDSLKSDELLPKIKEFIKDDKAAADFEYFVDSYRTEGVTATNIAYDKDSVNVYKQGEYYYYESTVESALEDNQILRDAYMSYLLKLRVTDKGEFILMDVNAETGHLVEGHAHMSVTGEINIIKNKTGAILGNMMAFNAPSKTEARNNLNEMFRSTDTVNELFDTFNFHAADSKKLEYFVFDDETLDLSYPNIEGISSMAPLQGSGTIGVVYTENGKEKKESFAFEILMTIDNPEQEEYGYTVEKFILKEGEFDWNKVK